MGESGSGQKGGGKGGGGSNFVTLTIPRAQAQDLVHALNLALGSEGEKETKTKKGKKGEGAKKK
jgi:hypothetical protein